jgi:hypothetical protein
MKEVWGEVANGQGDVKVAAAVLHERNAKSVLQFADDHASDLIVLETVRESHVFRTLWENVALHPGPCPVLTLRHEPSVTVE